MNKLELALHKRDLVWMDKLIDAGVPAMDLPSDIPDHLYTEAAYNYAVAQAKKEVAEEIKRELEGYLIWGQVKVLDLEKGREVEWTMRCIFEGELEEIFGKWNRGVK